MNTVENITTERLPTESNEGNSMVKLENENNCNFVDVSHKLLSALYLTLEAKYFQTNKSSEFFINLLRY